MNLRKLGDVFLTGGVIVGALAAVGYAADIVPDLPPAVLKLVIYKLTFIGGLGLVVFGAFLRRVALRDSKPGVSPPSGMQHVSSVPASPALREPVSLDEHQRAETRQPLPVRNRKAH
ncbi:MAG TPA: hypothetical protein VJ596_07205 [Gemmatimonadaceae bacterium]|nr:hypothetical protein [Gemmatimonadaceae bacterium]